MVLKGIYKLSYTLDKELKDLIVTVELRMIEGFNCPGRNVWEGFATLNGQPYEEEDLRWCVNAKIAAERIGHKLKANIKADAQKDGHAIRVKKEEIK
jgi:hypothetical protein